MSEDNHPDGSRRGVVVGLIGRGIAGSASPRMHEAEGAAQGLAYVYRLIDFERLGLDADDLPRMLDQVQALGFSGVNITHPYKQAAIPHLDDLSPEAADIGAVNTVVLRDGRRVGHNTDASGFAAGLKAALPDAPLGRVLQLGAGGAGAATAYALLSAGVERLEIYDTDQDRVSGLAERLSGRFGAGRVRAVPMAAEALRSADGLVNATPVGMAGHPGSPVPPEWLRPDLWVADVVYVPLVTALIAAARQIGAPTVDGGGMAVRQAAGAMALFTGLTPDVGRMRATFEAFQRRVAPG